MRIAIYHNVLGTKYKGAVFSQVYRRSQARGVDASFIQIAETEDPRLGFGAVEAGYHRYPFRLLFRGHYDSASLLGRIVALATDVWKHPCDLLIMPGYNRVEYWAMLAACMLLRRRRAVFCDSTPADRPRGAWKNAAKRLFFSCCDGFFCYGTRSKEYLMSYGVSESVINFRCLRPLRCRSATIRCRCFVIMKAPPCLPLRHSPISAGCRARKACSIC